MDNNLISFSGIYKELQQLVSAQVSGCFFIVTTGNKLAKIWLEKGEINSIEFINKRGEEALFMLMTIERGRCRFEQVEHSRKETQKLPKTSEILLLLQAYSVEELQQKKSKSQKKSAAKQEKHQEEHRRSIFKRKENIIEYDDQDDLEIVPPLAIKVNSNDIASIEDKEILRAILKQIIGPMADVICDEIFANYNDRMEIFERITKELEYEDRRLFRDLLRLHILYNSGNRTLVSSDNSDKN